MVGTWDVSDTLNADVPLIYEIETIVYDVPNGTSFPYLHGDLRIYNSWYGRINVFWIIPRPAIATKSCDISYMKRHYFLYISWCK